MHTKYYLFYETETTLMLIRETFCPHRQEYASSYCHHHFGIVLSAMDYNDNFYYHVDRQGVLFYEINTVLVQQMKLS